MVGIKTGSKKDFIKQGELGKIPNKKRLDKHKKTKLKSAYQRFLEENNQKDTSSGHNTIRQRIQKADQAVEQVEEPKRYKKEKEQKDFDKLSGDELLDMFN